MAVNLYSNCSTITTGCFFYSDSNLTSPVSNGKYSDGANCYTVSGGNGEITTTGGCSYTGDVYVTAAGPTFLDGAGDYEYILYADSTANSYGVNPVAVTASPLVGYVDIYTEFGHLYGSGSIGNSFRCSYNLYSAGAGYENAVVVGLSCYSVSPSSNGGQNYYSSGGDIGDGIYSCTP